MQWCIDACMELTCRSSFDVWPSTDSDNHFPEMISVWPMLGATLVI